MPCYHPVEAWKAKPGPDLKGGIVFSASAGIGLPIKIPCSQCIGCRLEKARQWAIRCTHEAKLWRENVFVTLTYAPEHLPPGGSLSKSDCQSFFKRLRRWYWYTYKQKIRYFVAGEYGDQLGRPHYHALIFNLWFPDSRLGPKRGDNQIWSSAKLTSLWGKGFAEIGSVTPDSAGYVARYALKKITGDRAAKHYERVDLETGEIHQLLPEFALMSRNPGLGKGWLDRYKSDFYPSDFVVFKGSKAKVPSYYDRQLPEDQLATLKAQRKANAKQFRKDNTPKRLQVRETVKKAQIKQLQRTLV